MIVCRSEQKLWDTLISKRATCEGLSYAPPIVTPTFQLLQQRHFLTCLPGVGVPGLVGLVSFVFTLWGTQNKRNLLPLDRGPPHHVNRV